MRLRKKTIAVTTAAFVIAGTTAALAFWTTGGSGSGTVTTAPGVGAVSFVVHINGDAPIPGAVNEVVVDSVNPNGQPVSVDGLEFEVVAPAGCNDTPGSPDFTVDPVTGPFTIPAGTTLELANTNLNFIYSASRNQDGCKTAEITVNVTAVNAAPA